MKCILCQSKGRNMIRAKKGYICDKCYSRFPESIQRNILSFDKTTLYTFSSIVQEYSAPPLVHIGRLGVTEFSVILNGFKYDLKNLASVRLNFHPRTMGSRHREAVGSMTLVLEIRTPSMHVQIEEPFLEHESSVFYHIDNGNITYIYNSAVQEMCSAISHAILCKTYNLRSYFIKFFGTQKEKEKDTSNGGQKSEEDRLVRTMRYFHLTRPYTKQQVRQVRNKILVQYKLHPDDGGSDEKCRELNSACDLLLKFAEE